MEKEFITRLEKLLDRELNAEEKERLQRIKDTLRIGDNDALWSVIAAMEYQRTYYEELPEKIAGTATEILQGISVAAEQEAALAQSRLAETVAEQAKKLSLKIHMRTWFQWGFFALALLVFYGSLSVWAGYCIGSEKTQPALLLLRMPSGILLGAAGMAAGLAPILHFSFRRQTSDTADGTHRQQPAAQAARQRNGPCR